MTALSRLKKFILPNIFLAQALTYFPADLAAGQVQNLSATAPQVTRHVRNGRVPGYFVAIGGNDGANGLAATFSGSNAPFATLSRAIQAAEASGIRTIYLGNGDYQLPSTVTLGPSDSGLSILAAPGAKPILDGSQANLGTLLNIDRAANVTIDGLTFSHASRTGYAVIAQNSSGGHINGNHFIDNGNGLRLVNSTWNTVSGNEIDNSAQSGMEIQDGSDNNVIDSNLINGAGAYGTQGGGIFMHGGNNNTVSHNRISNTAGMGIGVSNWDGNTVNIGNSVTNNLLNDTNQASDDSGAIYVLGRSHVQTRMIISGNVITGYGPRQSHTMGIYLDDMTSGVTVRNNVIVGNGTDAVQIHGGDHNTVTNNIAELGSGNTGFALIQDDPPFASLSDGMLVNLVTRNIITSTSPSPHAFDYIDGGQPAISGNLYWDPKAPARWPTTGPTTDAKAVVADPRFVGQARGNHALRASSPAHGLGFIDIAAGQAGPHPVTDHRAYVHGERSKAITPRSP